MTIAQRIGQVSANIETATRSGEFIACAKSLLAGKGRAEDAARFAEASNFSPKVVSFLKAAVTVGATNQSGWAQELVQYRAVADAFLSSLAPFSSFEAILNANGFTRLPMQTRVTVISTAAVGTDVAEGQPKPVTSLQFNGANFVARKAIAQVVVSDELALSANPGAFTLIGDALRGAVAQATDLTFLSVVSKSTGVMSNGSSGMSLDAFVADFDDALAAIDIGTTSKVYLIAPPNITKKIATMRGVAGSPAFPNMKILGGDIAGVTVVPSDSLDDSMIMLDTTGVAVNSLPVTLAGSREATLQLTDTPTDGVAELTSLWQNNLRAIRAERQFACHLLRADAVALITGVSTTA